MDPVPGVAQVIFLVQAFTRTGECATADTQPVGFVIWVESLAFDFWAT